MEKKGDKERKSTFQVIVDLPAATMHDLATWRLERELKRSQESNIWKLIYFKIQKVDSIDKAQKNYNIKYRFKETVSVISCDPQGKDVNARWFTTLPYKALFDQVWIRNQC